MQYFGLNLMKMISNALEQNKNRVAFFSNGKNRHHLFDDKKIALKKYQLVVQDDFLHRIVKKKLFYYCEKKGWDETKGEY